MQVCRTCLVALVEHGAQVQIGLQAAERGLHTLQDIVNLPCCRAVLLVDVGLEEIHTGCIVVVLPLLRFSLYGSGHPTPRPR